MRDVGIVMPIYKQEPQYLKQAIQTILNQTYQDFYLVIVFDGSPAETIKITLNEVNNDDRVHVIVKKKNEGVSKALNRGFNFIMKKKEVKYLTWVSSDNIHYEQMIEKLRDKLVNSPEEVGLVFSSFFHIDDQGERLPEPSLKEFLAHQDQPKEKLLDYCFIGVSFMYKKNVANKINGYYLEPVEDYDYWLRLTEHCDIAFIPEVLMEYRTDSQQSISAQLKNSIEKQRHWRYIYNLAKVNARKRRNIPYELTVIFPVGDGSPETIEKLESLLDQTFSNYKLVIIDQSVDKEGISTLQHISDPRIMFVHLPEKSIRETFMKGMEFTDTPYTLLYGEGNFPTSVVALEIEMRKENFDNDELICGKVYKTNDLKELLKNENKHFGGISMSQSQIQSRAKVLVNSIPKSGTHLLLQLILGIPGLKITPSWIAGEEDLDKIQESFVGPGHLSYSLHHFIKQRKIKTIFISRDLRDNVVSLVHFVMKNQYNHPWHPYLSHLKTHDERLMTMIKGVTLTKEEREKFGIHKIPSIDEFARNKLGWLSDPSTCCVTFEDLKRSEASLNNQLSRIIDFLGEDLAPLQLKKSELIAAMKNNVNEQKSATFRKGSIGDWKKEFKQEHKEAFKEVAGDVLIQLGYEQSNNW